MDRFVIRMWAPAVTAGDPAEGEPGIRGVVRHIGSGRTETFRDGCELLQRLIDLRAPIALASVHRRDGDA